MTFEEKIVRFGDGDAVKQNAYKTLNKPNERAFDDKNERSTNWDNNNNNDMNRPSDRNDKPESRNVNERSFNDFSDRPNNRSNNGFDSRNDKPKGKRNDDRDEQLYNERNNDRYKNRRNGDKSNADSDKEVYDKKKNVIVYSVRKNRTDNDDDDDAEDDEHPSKGRSKSKPKHKKKSKNKNKITPVENIEVDEEEDDEEIRPYPYPMKYPAIESFIFPFMYNLPPYRNYPPPDFKHPPLPHSASFHNPIPPTHQQSSYDFNNYPNHSIPNPNHQNNVNPYYYDAAKNKYPLKYKEQPKETIEKIPSYYCLAVLACILCPLCGICALCFSNESRKLYKAREYNTAYISGIRAKSFAYCAIATNLVTLLVLAIAAGTTVGILKSMNII